MHLKGKDWKRFWCKKRLQRVPEWPSYCNFCKVIQNPHFLRKGKFFSKIAQKEALVWKAQKHSGANGIIFKISMDLNCKDWKTFWRNQRLQKCPNGQVMATFARSPKSRIFWKSANGEPREIFQKSTKKMPSLKRPKSILAQMALSSN